MEIIADSPEIVEIEILKNDSPDNTPDVKKPKKERKPYTKKDKTGNPSPAKKNSIDDDTVLNIANIIQSGFGIASTRLGEHWTVDLKESTSIALPFAKILAKYNFLEKVENVSDPLALIIAVGTITIPRIVMTTAMKETKQQKVMEKNGGIPDGNRSNISSSKGNERITETDQEISNVGSDKKSSRQLDEGITHDRQSIKAICAEVSE